MYGYRCCFPGSQSAGLPIVRLVEYRSALDIFDFVVCTKASLLCHLVYQVHVVQMSEEYLLCRMFTNEKDNYVIEGRIINLLAELEALRFPLYTHFL